MSTGAAAVLAWTGAASAVVAGAGLLGGGMLAQARAATAADLAALAASDALAVGASAPCQVAAEAADRNGALLSSCQVQGQDVLVQVEVTAAPLPALGARARAGPSPTDVP